MRRTLRAAAIGLALAAPGCGEAVADPRDQWLIEVHTDALVPELGDRLLVEVLAEDDGACSGCRREHGVAEASAWPLSFGVLPEGNPRRVRARLYRGAESGPRGPRTDRGIDAIVALPAAAGVTHVRVDLTMRCFGVPADLAGRRSCDPSTGQLAIGTSRPPRRWWGQVQTSTARTRCVALGGG